MRKRVDIRLTVAAAFILAFTATVNANDVDTVNINAVDTINTNTVNSVDTVDAANAANADNVDTISMNITHTVGGVSAVNKDSSESGKHPPASKPDAAPPPLLGAYWGLGVGLSVGTVPIFPMWQRYFPNTLRQFGLSDTGSGETAPLRYNIIESPDAFNFALPFRLSVYSVGEKRVFSFSVSFFRNSKDFQSTLYITDTVTRRIDILERLAYYSASIEAAGNWAIPPVFFSVDGSQQTFLSLALGLSPVNAFTRECEIENDFNNNDTRMQTVADSVKKTLATISGNGLSLSWRIGISVIKRYPSGYGSELGLYYSGSYSNRFYSDGVRLTEEHIKTRGTDLNAESVTGGKPLSFLSNQAEFRATLLVPAGRKKN